jgi:hypothetical protein
MTEEGRGLTPDDSKQFIPDASCLELEANGMGAWIAPLERKAAAGHAAHAGQGTDWDKPGFDWQAAIAGEGEDIIAYLAEWSKREVVPNRDTIMQAALTILRELGLPAAERAAALAAQEAVRLLDGEGRDETQRGEGRQRGGIPGGPDL